MIVMVDTITKAISAAFDASDMRVPRTNLTIPALLRGSKGWSIATARLACGCYFQTTTISGGIVDT
jgi:hypothetical protein